MAKIQNKQSRGATTPMLQTTVDFLNGATFDLSCCVDPTNNESTGNCVVEVITACPNTDVCTGDSSCGAPMIQTLDFALLLDGLVKAIDDQFTTKINDIITNVNTLNTNVTSTIGSLVTNTNTATTNIGTLQTIVQSLKTSITDIIPRVNDLTTNVNALGAIASSDMKSYVDANNAATLYTAPATDISAVTSAPISPNSVVTSFTNGTTVTALTTVTPISTFTPTRAFEVEQPVVNNLHDSLHENISMNIATLQALLAGNGVAIH